MADRDGITVTDLWAGGQETNLRYRIRVRDPHAKRYESRCFANEREGMVWARARRKAFLERRATAVEVSWQAIGDAYVRALEGVPATTRQIQQVRQVVAAVHGAGARDITDPLFADLVQDWLSGLKAKRKFERRSREASPRLKAKFLVIARAICQSAVDRGTPLYNPLAPIRLPRAPRTLRPIFLPDELALLVADARRADPWWWVAVLGVYTGVRKSMALALRRSHFRLDRGEAIFPAHLPGNKTERDIVQPIQPELAALLREVPAEVTGPIVGWKAPHILEMGEGNVTHGFQDYVRRCGVDATGRGFHALRHSLAAILTAQGCNHFQVMDWLGHDSAQVSKDYARNAERVRAQVQGWPRGSLRLRP